MGIGLCNGHSDTKSVDNVVDIEFSEKTRLGFYGVGFPNPPLSSSVLHRYCTIPTPNRQDLIAVHIATRCLTGRGAQPDDALTILACTNKNKEAES